MDMVTRLGAEPLGVWMAEPVCVDGYAAIDLGENPSSRRFAYVDGAAEVARRIAATEGVPMPGHHIFSAHNAEITQASEALNQPGVVVEAVYAKVAIPDAGGLGAAPELDLVRILYGSPEWGLAPGDLSPQPPACGE